MQAAMSADAIAGALKQAKALLQSARINEAQQSCRDILRCTPDHHEALYTLAAAQRVGKEPLAALKTLSRLLELSPSYGRGWQERGHCLRELGKNEEAFHAYQAAVSHNGALAASWRMLSQLHERAGREAQSDFAAAQFAYLSSLPPELQSVASLIQENKVHKAEQLCRAYLQRHGHHIEAMRLLAEIAGRFNAFDEAEFLLESCKALAPDNVSAQFDYAKILRKRQKFEQALGEAEELRAKEPGNPEFEMLFANENLAVGNFDKALGVYKALLAAMPNNPGINLTYGHALKTVGRQDEAISSYRRAYQVRPDLGDAYWSLANLKTYRFTDEELNQMRAQEDSSAVALSDRYHLCFALGKALEDRAEFAESFTYYERGNRLKREELKYDPARLETEMRLQRDHVSAARLGQLAEIRRAHV